MKKFRLKVNGPDANAGGSGGHAAALGAPGRPGPQGYQVRVRHRPVRRLHRPRRRRAHAARASLPSPSVGIASITTIEGLSPDGSHPLQRAWEEIDVPQCGYCQAGQIMAAAALLAKKPKPDRRARSTRR